MPNGSRAAGDYSRKLDDLKLQVRGETELELNVMPEEEVFDDMTAEELSHQLSRSKSEDVERHPR